MTGEHYTWPVDRLLRWHLERRPKCSAVSKNSEFIRFLQYTSDNATGIFTIGIISFLHPKAAMTINQCYADYSDNILWGLIIYNYIMIILTIVRKQHFGMNWIIYIYNYHFWGMIMIYLGNPHSPTATLCSWYFLKRLGHRLDLWWIYLPLDGCINKPISITGRTSFLHELSRWSTICQI